MPYRLPAPSSSSGSSGKAPSPGTPPTKLMDHRIIPVVAPCSRRRDFKNGAAPGLTIIGKISAIVRGAVEAIGVVDGKACKRRAAVLPAAEILQDRFALLESDKS